MSANHLQRLAAKTSLNISLIEANWNWPSEEALKKVAEDRDQGEVDAINRDLEIFSRTRMKSCRLIKLLRDAEDEAWDLVAA